MDDKFYSIRTAIIAHPALSWQLWIHNCSHVTFQPKCLHDLIESLLLIFAKIQVVSLFMRRWQAQCLYVRCKLRNYFDLVLLSLFLGQIDIKLDIHLPSRCTHVFVWIVPWKDIITLLPAVRRWVKVDLQQDADQAVGGWKRRASFSFRSCRYIFYTIYPVIRYVWVSNFHCQYLWLQYLEIHPLH